MFLVGLMIQNDHHGPWTSSVEMSNPLAFRLVNHKQQGTRAVASSV